MASGESVMKVKVSGKFKIHFKIPILIRTGSNSKPNQNFTN